jgi:hypothetical protein
MFVTLFQKSASLRGSLMGTHIALVTNLYQGKALVLKLLHVDSSIQGAHSISRQFSAEIVANLRLADLERQCTILACQAS